MSRRISLVIAAVVLGLVASITPAAPAAAATPQLVISNAILVHQYSDPDLLVLGTVTCGGSTGQTEVSLLASQIIGGLAVVAGSVVVPCAAGPVPWEVELVGPGLHPGFVMVHGNSTRNGVQEAATSQGFTLY